MEITPLAISGAYSIANTLHRDDRGEFVEWFRADRLHDDTGLSFHTVQANLSVSEKGTVRGIHYADVPPGQAKYVMCVAGAIRDFVIDIRVGSPTFGTWASVDLDATSRNAVVLDVGLGHAFVALEPNTVVTYLVTDVYKPHAEHAINPLDSDVALEFPLADSALLLSPKDQAAPTLAQASQEGRLPVWQGS
ncbi:MAG: dTDP-4-dehydrorhamnose 3,5-epimerase [Pontimonas sp.]|nr:dTDP-4-dehydrorhamnose 3,5-epimerase [Pontimonas sp.]